MRLLLITDLKILLDVYSIFNFQFLHLIWNILINRKIIIIQSVLVKFSRALRTFIYFEIIFINKTQQISITVWALFQKH